MNQAQKINKLFRLFMVFLYLGLAVAVWLHPSFREVPHTYKILLTVVLVLYSIFRVIRFLRRGPQTNDEI